MSKIYIFSGLGVDQRVFENIDFGNLDIEFIDWIVPLRHEPIKDYAKRISQKITADQPILMGLSFGGFIAVEIAKIIETKKVILIASAKTCAELPAIYKFIGKLQLNKLVPVAVLKSHSFMTDWFFGTESKSDKMLLKNILKDTDPRFISWAIDEILHWQNESEPKDWVHIHGDRDRILPLKNVKTNFVIKDGGHFMTVNKAKEIEVIIKNILT
ncbi:conserved hypothetical protein [Flavobacteriaceae bacterium 3519-10]|nr:conserved hypothetical protein [Flavobacteriaceae bacterium 3519-10]